MYEQKENQHTCCAGDGEREPADWEPGPVPLIVCASVAAAAGPACCCCCWPDMRAGEAGFFQASAPAMGQLASRWRASGRSAPGRLAAKLRGATALSGERSLGLAASGLAAAPLLTRGPVERAYVQSGNSSHAESMIFNSLPPS